jgi:HSP20 family protein
MMLTELERFTEMVEIQDNFDSFLDRFWGKETAAWARRMWKPPIHIYEDTYNITAKLQVPGVKKSTLKILLNGNTLVISGKALKGKGFKEKDSYKRNIHSNIFTRSFFLPVPVDRHNVRAVFKDGLLQIILPKIEKAELRETCIALSRYEQNILSLD